MKNYDHKLFPPTIKLSAELMTLESMARGPTGTNEGANRQVSWCQVRTRNPRGLREGEPLMR